MSDLVETLRSAGCVFAEEEAALLQEAAGSPDELAELVRRRVEGLPLEQVVGWAEFCGLRLVVERGVFVPRRRTEALAAEALVLARRVAGVPVVLDLCCGVGAIGAAMVAGLAELELHASDVEPAAVACARVNLGAAGRVYEGDLVEPLPTTLAGRVDVLVANVPYVPTAEIDLLPAEARLHEPRVTLDGGPDGLRVLAKVADLAPRWLTPGGSVLCETSERQAGEAMRVLAVRGLRPRAVVDEDLGATVVVGIRPGRDDRG